MATYQNCMPVRILCSRARRPRLAPVLQQCDGLVLRGDCSALQVRDVELCAGLLQSEWNLHRLEEVENLLVEYFEEGDFDGVLAAIGTLLHMSEDVSDNPWDDATCALIALRS